MAFLKFVLTSSQVQTTRPCECHLERAKSMNPYNRAIDVQPYPHLCHLRSPLNEIHDIRCAAPGIEKQGFNNLM